MSKTIKPKKPKSVNLTCPYCFGACDPERDEWVYTKRKDLNYFHSHCFLSLVKNPDGGK